MKSSANLPYSGTHRRSGVRSHVRSVRAARGQVGRVLPFGGGGGEVGVLRTARASLISEKVLVCAAASADGAVAGFDFPWIESCGVKIMVKIEIIHRYI